MPERILVVDDEPAMLRGVERVLASAYRVATARTPAEALERARGFAPDLAVIDIRMPEMDGFELSAELREAQPGLDVIFMTGAVHELNAQLIRSIREKAFYFIQKPFDREVLLTLVERCLEVRRLAAQNRTHLARLESELQQARQFQQSLLPPPEARLAGASIATAYEPCDELGGDLVDYVEVDEGRLAALVADVSGHGVSAAMLTAVVKAAFHDAHVEEYAPGAVVRRVLGGLRTFADDRFVTLFCARFEAARGRLEYVNAGHPPALLFGRRGAPRAIARTGPMVTPAFPGLEWGAETLELGPGERLLAYTDGVTEARGADGELFGDARLLAAARAAGGSARELVAGVRAAVRAFTAGRPMDDDLTLFALSVEA